ncbi:MKRN2 opposite strand protein [Erinaceus europaeus]|uniref:MKRN2 opposite strand protein n=1 Tax=Erinaceus europaeus TaxID=9365 RepID=A0A1S2ZCC8_ERIEU|nr:MKRN2 opposite strand protein [Erinaceus europaeus]
MTSLQLSVPAATRSCEKEVSRRILVSWFSVSLEGRAMHEEAGQSLVQFRHCGRDIYCFCVPRCCPLCQQDLGSRKLEEAPVSLSSPFSNGHREPCAFVLRPTYGTFLREYDGRSDLHVGVTNTRGLVYNYTELGVRQELEGWEQSVSVPLLQPSMLALRDQWDRYLDDFSASGTWLPHRYHEETHNCATFALAFINCILATEGWGQLDKGSFTERFLLPRTRRASKYIVLHRAIEEKGFYATEQPPQDSASC